MTEAMEGSLYNKTHKIIVNEHLEEKECVYRISVESGREHFSNALTIKLTDDTDHSFLFALVLTQEDFMILKSEQGLRVDFENFPQQFIKLLSLSVENRQFSMLLDSAENCTSSQTNRPRSAGLFLKIIERNEFKNLCHLSLRMAPGTDDDVKRHLCNKLKNLQDELVHLRARYGLIEVQLEQKTAILVANTRKINDMEVKLAEERSGLKLEASEKIAEEREKYSQEIKDMERKHEKILEEKRSNIELLELKNRIAQEAKLSSESTVKELTLRNETLEKDGSRLSAENATLLRNISELERRLAESDQLLTATSRKLRAAEDSVAELSGLLAHAKRDMHIARDREDGLVRSIRHLEERLSHTVSQLGQAELDVKHLQDELTARRSKVAKLLIIAQKLEGELDGVKPELESKTKLLDDALARNMELDKELEDLGTKLKLAEETLKEREDTIRKQNDVNSYLHRQLNERDVSLNNNGPLKSSSFSTSLIAKNLPSVVANSTIASNVQNRSAYPWLSGQGAAGNTSMGGSKATDSSNIRPRLDPSYLAPDNTSLMKPNKSIDSASAYFPK